MMKSERIPQYLLDWFTLKGWHIRSFQRDLFFYFTQKKSLLLIAPTGAGKTLASFLPSIHDLVENPTQTLHTLYISPLKSLTQDIQHNLLQPIDEMQLDIRVEIRTSDTTAYQRKKQLKKPPHILLTTPESLMLLLSHAESQKIFAQLKAVIIDEIHSFVPNKRGDLTSLALAQLSQEAFFIRIGLSATINQPDYFCRWLGGTNNSIGLLYASKQQPPYLSILKTQTIPYAGFMANHATDAIYRCIKQNAAHLTIIFVNTRRQAENLFHHLWLNNADNLSIAIYHAALSKAQRQKTEYYARTGELQAIISTSALELGIDWKNVHNIIQVGAPHGIARLLQRVGRANHQLQNQSIAYLVPSNCFDALECQAAIDAIKANKNDEDSFPSEGAWDVAIQFIINAACRAPIHKEALFLCIKEAYPYRTLSRETFEALFAFALDGGYTLQHYEAYHRLTALSDGSFIAKSPQIIRRHRQNIGTITESARVAVKVRQGRRYTLLGEIEEQFAQQLQPGDTFLFSGLTLEYIRLNQLSIETRKIPHQKAKIPVYNGGRLPLSTGLSKAVIALLTQPEKWKKLPASIQNWLTLQQRYAKVPDGISTLIEAFPYRRKKYLVCYTFAGSHVNQSLGMLLTHYMEQMRLKPIAFLANDYTLAIVHRSSLDNRAIENLFNLHQVEETLKNWLADSAILKRTFRDVAQISGLIERQYAGKYKSLKQVTFSTDLIYQTLKHYEPNHILLKITEKEVKNKLLDLPRLFVYLKQFQTKLSIHFSKKPTPFAIPMICRLSAEQISGEAEDELLSALEQETLASQLIESVEKDVFK